MLQNRATFYAWKQSAHLPVSELPRTRQLATGKSGDDTLRLKGLVADIMLEAHAAIPDMRRNAPRVALARRRS